MNPVDYKYAGILSTRLEKFKVKDTQPYQANFRCYVCGDSDKSKTKRRGWILDRKNTAFYYCHNCGYSKPMWFFIKQYFPAIYDEYVIDSKLESAYNSYEKTKPLDRLVLNKPVFEKKNSPLKSPLVKKIGSLAADHPARKYVEGRKIPTDQHHKIWYAPKFKKWVNSLLPDKLQGPDEPRLIFPFIDKNGTVTGFNGRSFDPNGFRYITIMLEENAPKVFGVKEVDFNKPYYVVEGPIDSLFISNSIAMAGADGGQKGMHNVEHAIYVFDNEPRNKEILQRMQKVISRGQKLVIWPDWIKDKDINDMILNDIDVSKILKENTFAGLHAELRLTEWSKVSHD